LNKIIIGTRGSKLAQWQAGWVAAQLTAQNPGLEIAIQHIATKGDTLPDTLLAKSGDKGLFTREIESALLNGQIHLAVHSMKDMHAESPRGLTIGAIPGRGDARDVLLSRLCCGLDGLPAEARIGTSSLRRAAQLLAYRPDFRIVNLRGNVDTRLRRAATQEYDAIILAAAGLLRLGHADLIIEYLPPEVMLPAVGQGALAVQAREDDTDTLRLLAALDHAPTRAVVSAERAFSCALGGGCHVPIAAFAEMTDYALRLRGLVADPEGKRMVRGEMTGQMSEAESIGKALAVRLLAQGGREILGA
jgi:hydroxymethylbilane synthase